MKTKIIVLFCSIFFLISANAQVSRYIKAKQDLTPFTGTWVGAKMICDTKLLLKKEFVRWNLMG